MMVTYSPMTVWFLLTSLDPAGLAVLSIVAALCTIGVLRVMSDLW